MTKNEFIDFYMEENDLPREWKTAEGFNWPDGDRKIALPCYCGQDMCAGWIMIGEEFKEDHMAEDGVPTPPSNPPAICE